MKLAGKAQEDIYFAKVNRELIEALHRRAALDEVAAARAAVVRKAANAAKAGQV
jgi:hypothetical protein